MRRSVSIAQKSAFIFFWCTAIVTLGFLFIILLYILREGVPHISLEFLFGFPEDMGRKGGILPTIVGTIWLTAASLVVSVPIGLGAAIYLNEYTRKGLIVKVIRYFTENLAGVPSVVFGLFGFAFFVIFLKLGWSILSGALTLALMILPTLIRTSEEALTAVPDSYREGSLALGATKWQTIQKVVLPAALPGIFTGVILGIGRVVGETAAVFLTVGGALHMPTSIMDPCRPMTLHLYTLVGEGISLSRANGTAAVLVIGIFILNTVANLLLSRFSQKYGGGKGGK